MEMLGLTVPNPINVVPTMTGAYRDMNGMLEEGEYVPHGAAVADNDTVAIGVMKAIREAGTALPRTFPSSAWTYIPFSAVTMPALTHHAHFTHVAGTLAVDALRKASSTPTGPACTCGWPAAGGARQHPALSASGRQGKAPPQARTKSPKPTKSRDNTGEIRCS